LGIIIPTDFHIFHRVRSTTNHFSMVSNWGPQKSWWWKIGALGSDTFI
jgi:hypothetical protein